MNNFTRRIKKIKNYLIKYEELGTIYMLHRCSPINKENLYWNEHMKVSPEYLRNFLAENRKTHEFISLDVLYDLAMSGRELKKPFIIMTFDDGYRDNYEYVQSIFDEMAIPFTVYITNSFPDNNAFLWWYILEDVLQKNKFIKLTNGNNFTCATKKEKENVFLTLRQLILNLNQENLISEFENLFNNYEIDYSLYNKTLCLSWDLIKEMSNNRYCTIAAHSMNHRALNKISLEQLDYEILQSKKNIERHIEKNVDHFAYPFGTFNEVGDREIKFMKNSVFNTACYSFGGSITKGNIKCWYELPRVFFGELKH